MKTIEINLHPHQFEIYNDPHRFKVIACGRRFGKSMLASMAISVHAMNKPNGVYYIVAPVAFQTGIIWRMIIKFIPPEAIRRIYLGDKRIELKNDAVIYAKSGDNPDTLRGEGLDGCILDEAAMLKTDVWSEAIRPALSDKMGWCWLISTPKGKNWFYREYIKGTNNNPQYPDYRSFSYSTYMNPFLKKSEVDAMAEDMPEISFQQEILARFMEGGGVVFRDFESCIREGILAPYKYGTFYVMGVDLGRHNDFTVIIVVDSTTHNVVYFERFSQLDWTFIEERIKAAYDSYGAPMTFVDSTGSGDPIYERLMEERVNVFGINLNQASKPALIRGLSIAIDRRVIFFPRIPDLVDELGAYTFRTTHLNNVQYGAPEGSHDDTVIALALANYGINGANPSVLGMPTPNMNAATVYETMPNIVESWEDCMLDLGDPYGVSVIPELDGRL